MYGDFEVWLLFLSESNPHSWQSYRAWSQVHDTIEDLWWYQANNADLVRSVDGGHITHERRLSLRNRREEEWAHNFCLKAATHRIIRTPDEQSRTVSAFFIGILQFEKFMCLIYGDKNAFLEGALCSVNWPGYYTVKLSVSRGEFSPVSQSHEWKWMRESLNLFE